MQRNISFCWLLFEKCVVCVNVRKARSKEQGHRTQGWKNPLEHGDQSMLL